MLMFLTILAVAAPLDIDQTLETPRVAEADLLSAGTTVHVFLQIHADNKGREGSVETDASRSCAARIGETVQTLMESRALANAVVEGLSLGGGLTNPKPSAYKGQGTGAAATLSRINGLTLWGMELGDTQDRVGTVWQQMRDSAADLKTLRTDKETWKTDKERLERLYEIQKELYPATTEFTVASLPLRSFQALQVALTVADETDTTDVAIVIGAKHWPDFVYAIEQAKRLGNDRHVALRAVRYTCE